MRAHTWTLAIGAGALALAIGAGRAPAQAPAAPAPPAAQAKPAAVVNGEPIPLAQLEVVLAREGPKAVQLPEAKQREMRLGTLGMLIDELLLAQYLRQNGPRVDPAEVDKKVAETAEGLKKQGKTLPDLLRELGQTEAEMRGDVASMLQWRDYVKARVSDDDLKRYYTENKDFFDGITVHASHIVLRLPEGTSDAERQQTRDRLLAIRQEIVSGKLDFAAAAKKYSQCPTAPNGGDLGFFPRKGAVDEAFAKAAFALQVGQVSDVVQSEYGLHLIKVTERKPGQASDFTKLKDVVQQFYVMDLQQAVVAQMRKTSHIEINLP
jgi:peptidyl-prolyl cis-trans isomerase C